MFYITCDYYDIRDFRALTSVLCIICAKAGVTCLWQLTLLINWMCCRFYHAIKCNPTAIYPHCVVFKYYIKTRVQFLYVFFFCKTVFLV
jgi:hypothetical protein